MWLNYHHCQTLKLKFCSFSFSFASFQRIFCEHSRWRGASLSFVGRIGVRATPLFHILFSAMLTLVLGRRLRRGCRSSSCGLLKCNLDNMQLFNMESYVNISSLAQSRPSRLREVKLFRFRFKNSKRNRVPFSHFPGFRTFSFLPKRPALSDKSQKNPRPDGIYMQSPNHVLNLPWILLPTSNPVKFSDHSSLNRHPDLVQRSKTKTTLYHEL